MIIRLLGEDFSEVLWSTDSEDEMFDTTICLTIKNIDTLIEKLQILKNKMIESKES